MNKNHYAILMAGGVGSRFWPVSTSGYPKQFHDMLGTGDTLIQKTFKRLNSFIPTENILVLTNEKYKDLVREQLPAIQKQQVILEPAMRNTAPCILYAALKIHKENPEAIMVVAPSDHWIEDEEAFANNVTTCINTCEKDNVLCTLGIKPTFPNTGFGYIEFEKKDGGTLKKVRQFTEKPNHETALEFLERGNFLWNAGIFIWRAHTIITAFKKHQPQLYALFQAGIPVYNTKNEQGFIREYYAVAENISIDYAILEKTEAIYVLPATFDWSDLGTWGSLFEKLEKDTNHNALVQGKLLAGDARGNMIRLPKEKLAVIEGLQDFIVVDKEDVLLIIPKSREQDIKQILEKVKNTIGDHYA